jgi:hypothetical protein
MLRAAGVISFAIASGSAVGSLLFFSLVLPNMPTGPVTGPVAVFFPSDVTLYVFGLGELIGCAIAGAMLAREPLAAPALIALLLIGPAFAAGLPLWRSQTGILPPPFPLLLSQFFWLWPPLLGVTALFVAWSLARRRNLVVARM